MNQNAMQILNTLNTAGFEAYFCGGAVRDSLLGNEPKDTDVTTNATSEDILRLFPDSDFVGASFGVHLVKVNGEQFEVARFRVDSTYSDNRRPDSVKFTNNVAEDVTRRDFTVNALLMDADGKVTDLVGGLVDLENRVLRCGSNPILLKYLNSGFNEAFASVNTQNSSLATQEYIRNYVAGYATANSMLFTALNRISPP